MISYFWFLRKEFLFDLYSLIWLLLPGLELATFHLLLALLLAAKRLKITQLALLSFGFEVRDF